MIFQLFNIRSTIKEIKANPGNFASSQAGDVIIGVLVIPLVIIILGLGLLFAIAFTKVFGGPYLFFKIIFFISLIISWSIGIVIYKVISLLRRTTKRVVNKTVETVVKDEAGK